MVDINYNDPTTILYKSFDGMKIQGKEDTIDNTQQSMDLEYYADGNDCCTNDFGMPEINK
jgi:hypothetical protein